MGRQQRAWHVQRSGVAIATGQQRWDRAYQLLLRWTAEPPTTSRTAAFPILPEVPHAHSDLRPRFDQPSGRPPDD